MHKVDPLVVTGGRASATHQRDLGDGGALVIPAIKGGCWKLWESDLCINFLGINN